MLSQVDLADIIPKDINTWLNYPNSCFRIKFLTGVLLHNPLKNISRLIIFTPGSISEKKFNLQISTGIPFKQSHIFWHVRSVLTQCISEISSECVSWSLLLYTFVMQPIARQYRIWAQVQTSPEPHHYNSAKEPAEGALDWKISDFKHKCCIMTYTSLKRQVIINRCNSQVNHHPSVPENLRMTKPRGSVETMLSLLVLNYLNTSCFLYIGRETWGVSAGMWSITGQNPVVSSTGEQTGNIHVNSSQPIGELLSQWMKGQAIGFTKFTKQFVS